MPLRQLNRKEREDIIIGAKAGDKSNTEMITESFLWLKANSYANLIHKKDNIYRDDYYQDCDVKIIQCIKELNEINYGALSSLVKISIKNLTENIVKRNKRYNHLNVICSNAVDENKADDRDDIHNFDNTIVSDMVVYESYDSFIKHQLSPKENDIFFSHIAGESFEHYAHKNGMKVESVKRIFRKAVNKIINKEQIRKFHCIVLIILVFLQNIRVYIDSVNVTELMVK